LKLAMIVFYVIEIVKTMLRNQMEGYE